MELIGNQTPQRVLLATLGYTEGYITFEEYNQLLSTYQELTPEVLVYALSNRLNRIDDSLLQRLIRLVGPRLKGNSWSGSIRKELVKLEKNKEVELIDSYLA